MSRLFLAIALLASTYAAEHAAQLRPSHLTSSALLRCDAFVMTGRGPAMGVMASSAVTSPATSSPAMLFGTAKPAKKVQYSPAPPTIRIHRATLN